MLELKFHPDVTSEIKSSYLWYQAIIELPNTWPSFQKGFKRYLLSQFPFSVIYRQNANIIYVVAVMHNSRKPYYWVNRT